MPSLLHLVSQQDDKQQSKDCFTNCINQFVLLSAKQFITKCLNDIIQSSINLQNKFDETLSQFANNATKSMIAFLKQNNVNVDNLQPESYVESIISQYMDENEINLTKKQKSSNDQKCEFAKLNQNEKQKMMVVLTLERYSLYEMLNQELVKKKFLNGQEDSKIKLQQNQLSYEKKQTRLLKIIKKNLMNIQMDLELQKYEDKPENETASPEQQLQLTLQKLVIEPYGHILQTVLSQIFVELNFNDQIMTLLKDNKKQLKKRNVSPLKSNSKSPIQKKKKNVVMQGQQTQTEFIIPVEQKLIPDELRLSSEYPSFSKTQSVLQKRTFSSCFVNDSAPVNKNKRIYQIMNNSNIIADREEQLNLIEQQQCNSIKIFAESQQCFTNQQLNRQDSHISFTKKSPLVQLEQTTKNNIVLKAPKIQSNYIQAFDFQRSTHSRPSASFHRNFKASNIMTKKVKSQMTYNSQIGATTHVTPLHMMQKQSSTTANTNTPCPASLLLIADDSVKQNKQQKGSVLNRLKSRQIQNTQASSTVCANSQNENKNSIGSATKLSSNQLSKPIDMSDKSSMGLQI